MNKRVMFLLGLLYSGLVQAADNETELLIQGCAEVEAIYYRRNEKNLLAGINTSVAEALRAGYCKGVLEQYRRDHRAHCRGDWVEQARKIAEHSGKSSLKVDQLLRQSCG